MKNVKKVLKRPAIPNMKSVGGSQPKHAAKNYAIVGQMLHYPALNEDTAL